MSRSVMKPLSVGASLPESLSLLHRRLLVAEGQGAELAKKLGVSGDELGAEFTDSSRSEALVARVCRLESLLHTLRLSVFRIETERELNSSHTARLQEQLAALQEQCEEEQRSSQREVMRLRDQLQQEREEAQREAHTLREQLHVSHCSQMDVAIAADELKKVKVQLSRKLHQMKEELAQETAARLEAERSLDALLQRVKEMEGEVEREKEQVKLLQADCHALNVDGQEVRAELEEKAELIQSLQEECQQLRQQLEEKDILESDLCAELKSVKITLQKQQQENRTLLRGREETRAVTDKVQALNDQLEAQCSDLSSALRSVTEEKAQLQASLKVEQERAAQHLKDVDLRLDTAKRNMQCEVQEALAERRLLNKELETLRADHTKLQQSSAVALDAAVNHQELLERTIKRLRGELSKAIKEGETMQKEREEVCAELECVRTNYKSLQEQLKQVQEELQVKECQICVLRSEIEYVQRENLRLKDQLHNTHTKNSETLQTELGDKLDELHTLRQREAELHKAKQEINQLTKQVHELRKAKHHGRKSAQREVCELKKALDDVSSRSCDLSRTNRELREKVRELENLVSNQNARIKAQKVQLKQRNKTELNDSARSRSLEQLRNDVASLQVELLDLSSSQQEELQAERRLTHTLQEKCEMLEECIVKLKEERDDAEWKMKEVSLESQQIFENLQEAHSWFRSKFDSLKSGLEHSRAPLQEQTGDFRGDGKETSPAQDPSEVVCVAEPELERWASALQRWETKKELDRMANS
ncbi:coiled-coil domain-containing protein 150 isoform X1 [Pangasianodon hypophthalmus]|uniref:coiled-coil domain-containing protein 150 isoform X1 n=1 Tax=Pangasianodon hypophthalmus TaxID=310915 RepID=UPI0023081FB2|nr:coiled-coil domain-containing protein 150 isoform X1 [Pangasianodon hypophthalmus]